MVRSRTLTFATLLFLAACDQGAKPLTQLVLVADTDVAGIEAVQFQVSSEDGSRNEMSVVPRSGTDPAYVSVVRAEGPRGPLTVSSFALKNGERTGLARVQRVSFVPDQTRVVKMHLVASCIGKVCVAGDSCSETGCVPIDVPEEMLDTWQGTPPRIGDPPSPPPDSGMREMDAGRDAGIGDAGDARIADASTGDGGSAEAGTTDAGSADAGVPDSGLTMCEGGAYDLNTNPYHCGKTCATAKTCDNGAQANTINACIAGVCCVPSPLMLSMKCELENMKAVCKTNYGDCRDDSTGPLFPTPNTCETYLADDVNNCGACGKKCADVGKTNCFLGTCQ